MKKNYLMIAAALVLAGNVWGGSWSWSWHDNTVSRLLGEKGNTYVYEYVWYTGGEAKDYPMNRMVLSFKKAEGVEWNGKTVPPAGDYRVSTNEMYGNMAMYQEQNNGNRWYYEDKLQYSVLCPDEVTELRYRQGNIVFEEGADGPYVHCYPVGGDLQFKIFTPTNATPTTGHTFTIGSPAVYHSVSVSSADETQGTVAAEYKSGYVYASNREKEYKEGSVYTLRATAAAGYHFVCWTLDGERVADALQAFDLTITGDGNYVAEFAPDSDPQYAITVVSSDEAMGTVSGTGNYYVRTMAQLAAVPSDRIYKLIEWQDADGNAVGTTMAFYPIVSKDMTYTAVFGERPRYEVSAKPNISAGGTVTGGGTYYEDEEVTLRATANEIYKFEGWSTNGGATMFSKEDVLTVTVTEAITYTACFAMRPLYTVSLTSGDASRGTVSGGGKYYEGQTAVLTATPKTGYYFQKWSDGVLQNPRQAKVKSDMALTAQFATYQYNLPWEGAQAEVLKATESVLVYKYEWATQGTNPKVSMVINYKAASAAEYAGMRVPDKGNYVISTNETQGNIARYADNPAKWYYNGEQQYSWLTATNGTEYRFYTGTITFEEGADGPYIQSGKSGVDFRLANTEMKSPFSSSFSIGRPAVYYNVQGVSADETMGTVSLIYKSGYVYADSREREYKLNSVYTLKAEPKAGYQFVSWNDGNREAERELTITGNASYTARFAPYDPSQWNREITMSPYGFASFYNDTAYIIPDGGPSAMIYTGITGRSLTYETLEVIPAHTAVVFYGEPNATYTLVATLSDAFYANNLLKGTLSTETITDNGRTHYILSQNNGQGGWLWPQGTVSGVGAFTNHAHKAYLEIPSSYGAAPRFFTMHGEAIGNTDNATAIRENAETDNAPYYDILGRQVKELISGQIYIHNGKKIIYNPK